MEGWPSAACLDSTRQRGGVCVQPAMPWGPFELVPIPGNGSPAHSQDQSPCGAGAWLLTPQPSCPCAIGHTGTQVTGRQGAGHWGRSAAGPTSRASLCALLEQDRGLVEPHLGWIITPPILLS